MGRVFAKACFACGSMVLFYFLSVVFALRGENDRQAWEFTVCVGRIFIAHWYGHGAKTTDRRGNPQCASVLCYREATQVAFVLIAEGDRRDFMRLDMRPVGDAMPIQVDLKARDMVFEQIQADNCGRRLDVVDLHTILNYFSG